MFPIQRRWERGTRYYQVDVYQDLCGQRVLIQCWGRRGTRLGQICYIPCDADALRLLARVQQRRLQHGYCIVS